MVGGRYVPTEASLDSSWVQIEVIRDSVSLTCDQALFFSRRCSQRKNERLIQLLVESSVKSPESGLFSDWSGNKRQFAQMFAHFVPASRLC